MEFATQEFSEMIDTISKFLHENGGVLLGRTFYTILIVVIGYYAIKIFASLIHKSMLKGKVDRSIRSFVTNIFKSFGYILVAIAALSQLGVNTNSLAAVLAAMGLAIGLSLQSTLSNFAAGIMIIAFKFFKSGDYVEIGGVGGSIEDIDIFTVRLRSPDNKDIIVPNGQIITNKIINYTKRKTRRMDLVIGVSYDEDIKKVREILNDVVKKEKRILLDPAPQILIAELADSSVNFLVQPWVNSGEFMAVKYSLTEEIKEALDKNKILIPYPQRTLHIMKEPA